MTDIADKDVVNFQKFLGLRNTVGEESLEPSDLTVALNVDVTDALRVRRRRGHGEAVADGNFHSLWSNGAVALVVEGTELLELQPDYSTRTVLTGLTSGRRMWYTHVGDRVFFANGVQSGVFQNGAVRSWGIASPTTLPTAAQVGGDLPAGSYQYTMTYLRSDGQESGAPRSGFIELTSTGGILFEQIPVSEDSDVTFKRIYISPVNGDLMYALLNLRNAETSAMYSVRRTGTLPLGTQFLSKPPAGTHLATFAGRTLVAVGNRLYPSEPLAPELFDLRKGFLTPSPITLVAPMDDGVYLGCQSEMAWLPGRNPSEWTYEVIGRYGVIPGTLAYGEAEDIVEGSKGAAAMWASTDGICVGLNGGAMTNLTHDRFNYPVMDEGAAVVRDGSGSIQYLVTLRGSERPGNTA